MHLFSFSEKLADIIEESGKEEFVIHHRKEGFFTMPKTPVRQFPFIVIGLQKNIFQKEKVVVIRESRAGTQLLIDEIKKAQGISQGK